MDGRLTDQALTSSSNIYAFTVTSESNEGMGFNDKKVVAVYKGVHDFIWQCASTEGTSQEAKFSAQAYNFAIRYGGFRYSPWFKEGLTLAVLMAPEPISSECKTSDIPDFEKE